MPRYSPTSSPVGYDEQAYAPTRANPEWAAAQGQAQSASHGPQAAAATDPQTTGGFGVPRTERQPRQPVGGGDGVTPPPAGGTTPPPTTPAAANPWDAPLTHAYQKYLGRTPSAQELASHYGNPGGFQAAITTIKNSPEAYMYANTPHPMSGGPGGTGGTANDLQAIYNSVRAKGAPTASSLSELQAAFSAAGHQVTSPMYNGVPSRNELLIDGKKYKFTVGDVGDPGASWYDWGANDGGGGSGFTPPPNYGPMITPNGGVPPGLPYTPMSMYSTGGPNQPGGPQQFTPFTPPDYSHFRGLQDNVLQHMLTTPTISPEYVSRLNEQQKELALQRGQAASGSAQQSAVGRGVAYGGRADATQRRIENDTTQDLMRSQRDVANFGETTNRQGWLDALAASESALQGRGNQSMNFYNTLLGGQHAQDASNLGWQSFFQGGNQYDQDLAYRYAVANQNAYENFIRSIMGGA